MSCLLCHIFSSSPLTICHEPLCILTEANLFKHHFCHPNSLLQASMLTWTHDVNFHKPGLTCITPHSTQHTYSLCIRLLSSLLLCHFQISNMTTLLPTSEFSEPIQIPLLLPSSLLFPLLSDIHGHYHRVYYFNCFLIVFQVLCLQRKFHGFNMLPTSLSMILNII